MRPNPSSQRFSWRALESPTALASPTIGTATAGTAAYTAAAFDTLLG
jgi:hypothetical protein